MIRSPWMSDAGYASGVRAENALLSGEGLEHLESDREPLQEQMSLAGLGAALLGVMSAIVMCMGKLSQSTGWATELTDPPGWLLFGWGIPGLLYSGVVTILALAACSLVALLAVAACVFGFNGQVSVGRMAKGSARAWREMRDSRGMGEVEKPR